MNNKSKGRNKKEITDCTKAFLKLLYISQIKGGKGKLREKTVLLFDQELTPSPVFSKKTRGWGGNTFNREVDKGHEMQVHKTEKAKNTKGSSKIFNNKACLQKRQIIDQLVSHLSILALKTQVCLHCVFMPAKTGTGQGWGRARVSQQGEQNWLGHSHLNLEKIQILKNISGRILDNDILCFSEFYKKNEGKSLLFSSKRCKLK